ncbi:hypothetical protein BHE74_00009564 [Ensete ventricosum]|uniref:Uncharacterized protein n=1 Tax=Ensete ventricosum TaxID=4639 RepID=A0A426ZC84_ENSVE|nr:hypothetical protein B296_00044080 [Ensete ventricosum]RWW82001.1 hypothetical protein BHE74_00009564 [Ensete ventricosum]
MLLRDVTLSTRPFSFPLATSSSCRLFSYKSSFVLENLGTGGIRVVTTVDNRSRSIMFPGGSKALSAGS